MLERFIKTGPYTGLDHTGKTPAYIYQCVDCSYRMITVAETDLLDENRDLLESHAASHVVNKTKLRGKTVNWPTGLSSSLNCERWEVTAHDVPKMDICPYHDILRTTVVLRRIGWLDQKGNVWIDEKAWRDAGGPNGSITPLLINPGCD